MSNASNLSTLANVLDDGSSGQFLKSTGSGGVAFDTVAAGAVVYATADLLPLSGNSAGDMAYVTATNRFYINNGSGWYSVSLVNTNPNITSVQDASSGTAPFTLATDGTATVITVTAADPEDIPLTYGYSVTTGNASLNGSTVAQGTGSNTNVFTVTPHASQEATFTITFTASDGINQATSANEFSLTFITIVTDSNHTTLLATATSTGGNVTIEDSSTANSGSGHSITVAGDAYAGTFSPYRSGGYSTHLDNGEEISFPDSANYDLSNGSFSIEAWVYPTSYDSPWSGVISQFSSSNRGWGLAFSSTQITFLGSTNGGSSTNVLGSVTSSVPLNQWTHLLVTRSSNTIRIFNNGVLVHNFAETGTFNNSTNPLRIGELNSAASENFIGYLRDIRFLKGSIPTEYQTSSTTNGTTIFSVPSEPLTVVTDTVLLTCHLPYISDGSANDATPTLSGNPSTKPLSPYDYEEYDATDHGGSVYFDGAGDRIEIAGHSSLVLDTSDFTVEFWYKHVANVTTMRFLGNNYQNSTWGGGRWTMGIVSGKLIFQINSLHGTGSQTASTVNIDDGFWHHCSLTRNGSTFTLRVDGGDAVTYNNSGSVDGGNSYGFTVGSRGSGNESINGYISDFRIVKGTAVYSGNFTPPTGPLTTTGGTYPSATNVNTSITASNTSLLIKGTDASIIDKSQGSNLKLVGTATGSTDQVRSGNWANTKTMKFDGNSDYITIPNNELYGFGADDWTIETWLYCTKTGGFNAIFDTRVGTGTETGSFGIGMYNTGRVQLFSGGIFYYPTDTLSFNTWQHLAVVKNSGTTTMYFNGTAASLTYSDSRNYGSSQPVQIGKDDTTSNYFGGYMQDFRITKGLARYTGNFTPLSAPLEG